MKSSFIAIAASSLLGSAAASMFGHVHGHAHAHEKRQYPAFPDYACCKSVVTVTVYASPTLPPVSSMAPKPTSSKPAAPVIPAPTPIVSSFAAPGTYTIPAKTVVITSTQVVAAQTTTTLTKGVNTYGGVVTVVTTSTTVVCPYATVVTSDGVATTVVTSTTYVCPSAGTYTPVPPSTTTVAVSTVMVYPVPATYTPGTYIAPASTVTVTNTDYVYICPLTISVSPSPMPNPPSSAPAVAPAAVTSSAPAPPASSAPAAASSVAPVAVNGNKWAMTYTPYSVSGTCKSADEVKIDIALIASKGFTTVRLYATDCSGLDNVGAAAKAAGVKMIVGVFIKGDGIDGARPQIKDIVNWGKAGNFGIVSMIVVGNEAIFNGYTSASALASFIGEAKSAFVGAGYSGPVTTTEPLNILQANAATICAAVDVIAGNVQPFFNSGVKAEEAGQFVKNQIEGISKTCPGKAAYNLESGWPSAGKANGAAQPGPAEQKAAISSIIAMAGSQSVIFSFHNDDWKHPGEFGVEQNFGCSQLF